VCIGLSKPYHTPKRLPELSGRDLESSHTPNGTAKKIEEGYPTHITCDIRNNSFKPLRSWNYLLQQLVLITPYTKLSITELKVSKIILPG
jgi:hypothetical protein